MRAWRVRLTQLTLAVSAAAWLALPGGAPPTANAQEPHFSGAVPFAGGLALTVWNSGTTADLEQDMRASGCLEPSAWTARLDGSGFLVHIFGAPPQVNAAWQARFANGIPAGQVLVLRCARDAYLWPFASDSVWNTAIGSGAQFGDGSDPRTVVASLKGTINAQFWSHPVYLASNADPVRNVIQDNRVFASVHIPDGATPALPDINQTNSDSHMHVVSPDHHSVLEMFGARRLQDGSVRTTYPIEVDLTGSGIAPRSGISIGTRAYGGSAIGGLLRTWEIERREIRHAIAIALPGEMLKMGEVWPASTQDNNASSTYRGSVPMGTLFAIPPNVDINSLGLSPSGIALARALQDYGAYVTDRTSGGVTFYAEPTADGMLEEMRADATTIVGYLRPVLNSGESTPGGGGTPRAPFAPPLAQ